MHCEDYNKWLEQIVKTDTPESLGRSPAISENALYGKKSIFFLVAGNPEEVDLARQAMFDNALAQARYQNMMRAQLEDGSCLVASEGDEKRCLVGASVTDAFAEEGESEQWLLLDAITSSPRLIGLHDEESGILTEDQMRQLAKEEGLVYTSRKKARLEGYPTAPKQT